MFEVLEREPAKKAWEHPTVVRGRCSECGTEWGRSDGSVFEFIKAHQGCSGGNE